MFFIVYLSIVITKQKARKIKMRAFYLTNKQLIRQLLLLI
jgi:hypothetical protein